MTAIMLSEMARAAQPQVSHARTKRPSAWATELARWILGSCDALPDMSNLFEDEILLFIRYHRLEIRCLHRIEQLNTDVFSKRLIASLTYTRWQILQRVRQQLDILKQISQVAARPDQPIILFKGLSTYMLTGNLRHLRMSGDLDIFAADVDYAHQELKKIGFTGESRSHRHEIPLSREDAEVELHHHFPVWSYPADIALHDFVPAHNPGSWVQNPGNVIVHQLQYADIARSVVLNRSKWGQVAVPNPTMAVFLRASHAMRNYIHLWQVSLAELADIYDLVCHSDFDPVSFSELVAAFDAHDVVDFDGALLESLFDHNPLGQKHTAFDIAQFPIMITGDACCWAALRTMENLLLPIEYTDVATAIGANRIMLGTEETPRWYSPRGENIGENIDRFMLNADEARHLPIAFAVRAVEDELIFELSILERLPEGACYTAGVQILNLSNQQYHIVVFDDSGIQRVWTIGGKTLSLHADERSYTIRMSFQHKQFMPRLWAQGEMTAIVILDLQHGEKDAEKLKMTIPISISQ